MGEEGERQGMNHGNSAVSHPRSRGRMTDGHGDNSHPLPLAFWRKKEAGPENAHTLTHLG